MRPSSAKDSIAFPVLASMAQRVASLLGWKMRSCLPSVQSGLREVAQLARFLDRPRSPGALDARLRGTPEIVRVALFAAAPRARPALRGWHGQWRSAPDPLDGHAARRLGARGPAVGALLRAARRHALDGGVVDEAWCRRWLAARGGIL